MPWMIFSSSLAGMPGDMHFVHRLINNLAAALKQLVYNVADGFFVAKGNRPGRNDDKVARAHLLRWSAKAMRASALMGAPLGCLL